MKTRILHLLPFSPHFLPSPFPLFSSFPCSLVLIPSPSVCLLYSRSLRGGCDRCTKTSRNGCGWLRSAWGKDKEESTVSLFQSLPSCLHFLKGEKGRIAPLTQATQESKTGDTSSLILSCVNTLSGKSWKDAHRGEELLGSASRVYRKQGLVITPDALHPIQGPGVNSPSTSLSTYSRFARSRFLP